MISPDLNSILTAQEAAAWLRVSVSVLLRPENASRWPSFGRGRSRRWNVRTVLAAQMLASGKGREFVQAALGVQQ